MVLFLILMLIFVFLMFLTVFVNFYLMVPFAPSNRHATQAMIQAVPLKPTDIVYELGSGDGRLAFALNKTYGCAVVGFELAPLIFLWAQLVKLLKRSPKVTFLMKNFLSSDLNHADYLYCYLTPGMLDKLAKKIETDHCHATIISHSFAIHHWKPFEIIPKDITQKTPVIYIYKT
ncbi:class I SAM-dependent methyltransferase [Candidatus Peregrinibacteria bacterium]|nr:class I SAM-dependent methyltransferase [Candidatus Peregrinibacteria bacterium]